MEENGRFAVNLLSRYIQSAGFVMIDDKQNQPQMPTANKISGCDLGFVKASGPASLADLACRVATPNGEIPSATIAIFSETDTYNATGAKYQGFDCLGQSAIPVVLSTGTTTNEIRSYFFISRSNVQTPNGSISMGQLSCTSDRTPPAGAASFQTQPLIPGIEQLAFNYLLPAEVDPSTARSANTAKAITDAAKWPSVLAVEVCVLAKTIQASGNDTGTTYTDCYGTALNAAPNESYRTFRSTVRIRNKTSS